MKRRNFLSNSAALVAGAAALSSIPSANGATILKPTTENPQRKRVLRIAHFTDIHLQPERNAPEGLRNALHKVQTMSDKPDILFTGGDNIMDALEKDKVRTALQFELFKNTIKNECSLPVKYCIGNHDVWGWGLKDTLVKQDELYGKEWAVREFGLSKRYYSFEMAGWKFIFLDSTHTSETGIYTAKLDEEQFVWLENELKHTPASQYICIVSHIPILSITPYFFGDNAKTGNWQIPGAWVHIDAFRIKNLFKEYKNLKICLSGHMHMNDVVEYIGVKYLCNGAVCGAWWKGTYHEFPPAYVIVDLYEDGTTESEFVPYV